MLSPACISNAAQYLGQCTRMIHSRYLYIETCMYVAKKAIEEYGCAKILASNISQISILREYSYLHKNTDKVKLVRKQIKCNILVIYCFQFACNTDTWCNGSKIYLSVHNICIYIVNCLLSHCIRQICVRV
ncbi:hypothetical protein PUN28_003427 [Cardiocondyla obscurior]|uniref:Uncharacterized protein n=1 Tax=Cardiocondyla obscurior TaxID=286306 RepID=A0AAW2GIZ0_9HYME